MLLWFAGCVIAHDLLLYPLYALADRGFARLSAVNYLRIPLLGAGLTFLLFFPGIVRDGAAAYEAATGLTQQPFLGRWLLLVAAMFAVSALTYATRSALARRGVKHRGGQAPHQSLL